MEIEKMNRQFSKKPTKPNLVQNKHMNSLNYLIDQFKLPFYKENLSWSRRTAKIRDSSIYTAMTYLFRI